MAQATANPEQQAAQRENRPVQAQAARAYQKVKLTEATEDELLITYAPVISQMVYRFVPLARVTVDADDLKNIEQVAKNNNANFLITTEKDLVKINNYKGEMSLYAVRIKVVFEPETLLNKYLEELVS